MYLQDFASLVLSSFALLFPELMYLTEVLMAVREKSRNLAAAPDLLKGLYFKGHEGFNPTLSTLDQVASNRSNCIFINEWVHCK